MSQVTCKLCAGDFPDEKTFHAHLRSHKITMEKYYTSIYNKKDLLTGELLPFKNREHYLSVDFITKTNLNKWIKTVSPSQSRNYLVDKLKKYCKDKDLVYAPCSVELRTINSLPSIKVFCSVFKDYLEVCKLAGVNSHFIYNKFPEVPEIKPMQICIDTREQKPYVFDSKHIIVNRKIDFGDYCRGTGKNNMFIERKSLGDFVSTLSIKNYERFNKEINRSKEQKKFMVVLIEEEINNALNFASLPHIFSKVSPDFIFHKMREIIRKFDNTQFLFVAGRKEAARVSEKLLFMGESAFIYDLQKAYSNKEL